MRQIVIPLLASMTKPRQNGDACCPTKARGLAVLNSPLLNKGTAFTSEERKALGLTGLLPPDIGTLATQVESRAKFSGIVQQVQDAMWQPGYRRIQAA